MSLLIWLPLHGNLKNYGNSNLTFKLVNNGSGLSWATTGKTESQSCQRITKNTADYIASEGNLNLTGDFTMCCWCKLTDYGTTDSANGIITNHSHTEGGAGITMRYISASDYRMSFNAGTNSSNRVYNHYYGGTNIYNAWHHLCLTYDKSTTTYKMYVDGKQETLYYNGAAHGPSLSYGNTAGNRLFCLFAWSTAHLTSGSYRPKCQLNDVRVYDHCLSAKEVKLVSQGLVAHYKLNGGGANNLLINTTNPQSSANLAAASTGFSIVPEYALDANVFQSISSTSDERFIYSSRTPVISKSTSYTFSCDLWANDYVKSVDLFWLSDTDATQKTGSGYVNITSTSKTISKRNGWFHVSWTFTTKADDRTGYIRIDNNGSSANGTDAILRATNLKLEKGTKETGYSMSTREVPFTVADDSSGYQHHGTTSGTFNLATDSPRYQTCTIFNGSTNRINLPIKSLMTAVLKDKCTINFWVNESNISSRSVYFGGYEGSNFNIEESSGKFRVYWNASPDIQIASSVTANTWAMYSVVTDIKTGIKIYKNGALIYTHSGALTDITTNFTNATFRIGSDSRTGDTMMEGKMSDFRIYCSALSAEDILTLYQSAGSATRDGGLIAYEFQESMNAPAKIQRTGIFNAKNFSEKGFLPDVKITTLPDNSAWARVFYHKNHAGTVLFTSVNEVLNTNTENKFSCLYLLDQLKGSDGKYEFMMTFPAQHAGKYNRWKQTNNPCKEYVTTTSDGTGVAAGYTAVHIDWTNSYWGGLTRQNSSETTLGSTYLSGSVGHSNWFYAIGAASKHDGGIPGPYGGVQETELWVRIDTLPSLQKLSILKEQFVTTSLLHEI